MRRQEALIERLRQLIPDVDDRLAESDSDEPEMWHDEHGADDEMWHDGLGADVKIEPVTPVTDDVMDLSKQGSEDYDANAEREDSSDGSD